MECGRFRALTLRPTNGLTLIKSFDTKFLFIKIIEIVTLSVHNGSQLRLSSKTKNKQTDKHQPSNQSAMARVDPKKILELWTYLIYYVYLLLLLNKYLS